MNERQATTNPVADERTGVAAEPHAPLFEDNEGRGLRSRWEAIQTGFVDEPRAAVEQADALVSQIMSRLTQVFADERTSLEQQWSRGDNVSTEDLRLALKRYRSFFERLLAV
jgi:hypothetical protein